MADVEAVLKWIVSTAAHALPADAGSPTRTLRRRAWLGGAVVLVGLIAVAVFARLPQADRGVHEVPVALTIPPPEGGGFTPTESSVQSPQVAMSPDGRYLAFVASGADGVSQL